MYFDNNHAIPVSFLHRLNQCNRTEDSAQLLEVVKKALRELAKRPDAFELFQNTSKLSRNIIVNIENHYGNLYLGPEHLMPQIESSIEEIAALTGPELAITGPESGLYPALDDSPLSQTEREICKSEVNTSLEMVPFKNPGV